VSSEVSGYSSSVSPILTYAIATISAFNSNWSQSLFADEAESQLQLYGSRAANSCSAMALVSYVPPEALQFDLELRNAVGAVHALAGRIVDHVRCCGTGLSQELRAENAAITDELVRLELAANELQRTYDATVTDTRNYTDPALGIEITLGTGWLASSQGLSPVFHAPLELNLNDAGPDGWGLGAGLRLRRLRNPEPLDVNSASIRFVGLVSRLGEIKNTGEIVIDGVTALRHELIAGAPSRDISVTVFVSGGFTYFVESVCSNTISGACDAVDSVASTLRILR
jgi:hypothetical protein